MKSAGLRFVPAGSVLLTSRATIGMTAINAMPVVTNQGFQNLVCKKGTDVLWLYYLVSSSRGELQRRASGSTFGEVSRNSVRSLPILLPPLAEQRAIAAVLDSIDDAIEGAEAVIAATEQLRDSLLHELLTRGVPGWHTEWREAPGAGTIPADWEVARLGDVASLRTEQVKPVGYDSQPYVALEHIVSGGSLTGYGKASDSVSYKTTFCKGDTLYGKLRPNLRKVVRAEFDGVCSTEILAVRARDSADAYFLSHLLRSEQLYGYAMQGITGTKMPRTSWGHLRGFEILLPPLPEQQAIAAVLDGVDETIDRTRAERDRLQCLKESTADALLTGRVRVNL